ncbi:putative phosphodiesterase I [Dioscorea sansibarensis]
MVFYLLILLGITSSLFSFGASSGEQPLSRIAIHRTTFTIHSSAYVKASPSVLGLKGESKEWVTLNFGHPNPSSDDWIGVFSPANFSASVCAPENEKVYPPTLCTSPIKFQYANYKDNGYNKTGKGSLKLLLINQREDFSFALFSGGFSNPKLVAVSNTVTFAYPKAPVYPRLAQGKSWDEMTVTWTSGYSVDEATPFVEWVAQGGTPTRSPAGTLTISRSSMCGAPARTVGWRDPGYIHTSFLKDLWPNMKYAYRLGHKLNNGSYVWSHSYSFRASPFPGQESLQHVIIFGDMGKAEADGSNEYNDFQPASLNTTNQLIKDLENIDIVLHIGDLCYANGYISQWDQFTAQIEPIASTVPYMVGSGNHERDWPGTGSFYGNMDSGGECGVLAETMFYVPADNRAKFWYRTDYGMFRFCIADTEHDWRPGTEQYKFIEHCLASVDRRKQPWLIFLAHRVLGYSSGYFYGVEGSFEEPMGRESLQELWQKYKVDIAFYGHVHNYERTCPVYQNTCMRNASNLYTGPFAATTHVVVGGGGASLAEFTKPRTQWSYFQDFDYGFVKLTAFNDSTLLFEYKKSSDGKVYDHFIIARDYRDILACAFDSCPRTTLAT